MTPQGVATVISSSLQSLNKCVWCHCPPPQKLSDTVLPVWSQRQALTVQQANVLVLLATFALRIMRSLLQELVGGAEGQSNHTYRDSRVVAALLSLHMVLCSAPHSGVISNASPEVRPEGSLGHSRAAITCIC